jgi:putative inorganic carbon (hco3(-)) transporter
MGRRGIPGLALLAAAILSLGFAAMSLLILAGDLSIAFACGVAAAVVLVALTIATPYYGLLAYIAVTYLRPGDRYVVLQPLRLVLLLAALTFGVWLAQYLIRRKPPIVRHRVFRDMGWLVAAGFVSMIPVSVTLGINYLINGLLKAMALSVVTANLTRTAQRLKTLCWLVVVSAAANSVLAWQALRLGDDTTFEDRAAGIGVLNDPNDLALTLVMALPVAIALFVGERGFYRRFGLATVIAALIGGVVVSQSRGGALGLMVVLFLEGYDRIRSRSWRTLYTAVGLSIGLLGVTALLVARGQSWGQLGDDPNVYNRKGAWVAGYRMMMDNPITGVGLYHFPDRLDEYGPSYLEQRYLVAHNSVVQVAAELGVPGLLFFLLMLGHAWTAAGRVRQLADQVPCGRTTWQLAWAMRRMWIGWLVCAMFLAQAYQVWLYLMLGIIVTCENVLLERQAALAAGEEGE